MDLEIDGSRNSLVDRETDGFKTDLWSKEQFAQDNNQNSDPVKSRTVEE